MAEERRPDFRIITLVYNDHIMRRMAKLGIIHGGTPSIRQLIERMGYGYGKGPGKDLEVRNIIGLKTGPTEENGAWKPLALEIATTLQTTPEELWPGKLKHRPPAEINKTLYVNAGQEAKWLIMSKA